MRNPFDISARFLLVVVLLSTGCGSETKDQLAIPDSPDGTVRVVMDGLVQHRPEVLWRALPLSYQQDVNSLTTCFAENMDAALFERAVAVARKGVVVLQGKKDLVLATETVANSGIDVATFDALWESYIHIADVFLASDLARLEAYATMNVEGFLETDGAAMMDHAAGLKTGEEDADTLASRLAALESTSVELIGRDGDQATLLIAPPDQQPVEVAMVRVEERWLPVDLVERWPSAIEQAMTRIEMLGSDEAAQARVQALFAIGIAEGFIDQIEQMEVPEDLDNLIGGILGNFIQQQSQTRNVVSQG
jgi:hypothetical protein